MTGGVSKIYKTKCDWSVQAAKILNLAIKITINKSKLNMH